MKTIAADNRLVTSEGIPRLVKKRAVAGANSVSLRTVDNWKRDGCPHIKPSARLTLFDLEEVQAWLKSRFGNRHVG